MKIYVHTNTCTLKFIEALFIIVKNLKSPTEKWIRILWYIPEMFLSNKKNKLLRYNYTDERPKPAEQKRPAQNKTRCTVSLT